MSASGVLLAADVAVAVTFVVLAGVSVRHRTRPGAPAAGVVFGGLAVLAGLVALGHAGLLAARVVVYGVGLGWIALVPAWTAFAFAHTGRGPAVTRRWLALAAGYVLATLVATHWGGAAPGALGSVLRVAASLLQVLLVGVGQFGVFLVVQSAVADDDLPTPQALALSVGGLGVAVLLFAVGTASAEAATVPPLVTVFLVVIATGFAVGVGWFRAFATPPGLGLLARRSVLESMSEALVVVDRADRLVDANAAAERTLGVSLAQDAGRPVDAVLGDQPAAADGGPVTLSTPEGTRQFDVSRSTVRTARGDPVGTAYRLADVTDEVTRRQRLAVCNRLLRHNLRNDLDAIRGFAEALADGSIDDPEEVRARIGSTAEDLTDVGTSVERAERMLTGDALTPRRVALPELATDVCEDVVADGTYTVTAATDDDTVTTDPDLLRTALQEVVDNAARHVDAAEPTVDVRITRAGDRARITVRDEGPGIPDRERAVLAAGEETPLTHGTGIGLWLTSWALARLGGELSISDRSAGGSDVRLTVPDRARD